MANEKSGNFGVGAECGALLVTGVGVKRTVKIFGRKLAAARIEAGFDSQEKFARKLDVSTRRIEKIEAAEQISVFHRTIHRMRTALGMTEEQFMAEIAVPDAPATSDAEAAQDQLAQLFRDGKLTKADALKVWRQVASSSPAAREARKRRGKG